MNDTERALEALGKARSEIAALKLQNKKLSDKLDALITPMPCGHAGKYAYAPDKKEGTTFCVVCEWEDK